MDGLAKTFDNSSTVNHIRYLQDQKILEVTFTTRKVYRYFSVEPEKWNEAIKAESIGKFLNTEIKGKHEYKLMN